ncbi:MAG: SgcJ/EcaC family oxidoreductase [Acidobacteriota bacterium]|nr:SgcJ/EcaC family oxidoreductase [Acidobacteriota bacterium]
MKRLVSITALVILTACSSSPKSSDFTPGDAENAIRRMNSDLSANARAGNAQAVVDNFYAPDAIVMAPNVPALRGRDAVRGFWTQFLASGAVDVALTPNNVMQSCSDMAVENGRYDLTITPKGGQAIHDTGKYIVVWKKAGGRWWAVNDIFNSDVPLPK